MKRLVVAGRLKARGTGGVRDAGFWYPAAPSLGCDVMAKAGWYCSREPGHTGPCALWPTQPA